MSNSKHHNGPTWDTPARISGLPVTNWKKRTGATMDGPLSACIKRWLDLPTTGRRDASIGWGPSPAGEYGHMECHHIIAFILRHGLPPGMEAFGGTQPPREVLKRMVVLERPEALTEDEIRQLPLGHSSPI